ncbi:MAG: methyltransferase domain-containing protein [Candidatus Lokiarchaeota archaeon]|nr:methyltransferase domain-containing protein [Candidatus Lokiarchaeota archaeon]
MNFEDVQKAVDLFSPEEMKRLRGYIEHREQQMEQSSTIVSVESLFTTLADIRSKMDVTKFLAFLENLYLPYDKNNIRRTTNLDLIPDYSHRRGGKIAYAEWAHVIGIFQTIIGQHLPRNDSELMWLDVGCGTGILAIAAYPLILEKGKYIGIDVQRRDIEFCREHYPASLYEFQHLDAKNAVYSPLQDSIHTPWKLEDSSVNLVTALSVWTHFDQADALFYFQEVDRVLKSEGKAFLTFFLLDKEYEQSLAGRSPLQSAYHKTPTDKWIFDQYSVSTHWRHPEWAKISENAIGVTPTGIQQLLEKTDLLWEHTYLGNWKEKFGLFFQDILVFKKRR